MRKSDGTYTYFVPDVAYHIQKFSAASTRPSTSRAATTTAPSRACAPACRRSNIGIPQGYPDYVLHKMVTVMKDGEEVKISKRAGSYVTVRDLIEWSGNGDITRGRDAVRFFLISRKADTEFVFDVDVALAKTTRTRCITCSTPTRASARPWPTGAATKPAGRRRPVALTAPREASLLAKLAAYPECCSAPWPNSARTRSRSTCANWPANCTATTMPTSGWSTTTKR
jgi:arginyl-tRNA synthetase